MSPPRLVEWRLRDVSGACPVLLQMMEASLYDKIMDQQRLEPEFFRVGFYGKKFPFFLRVSNALFNLLSRRQ